MKKLTAAVTTADVETSGQRGRFSSTHFADHKLITDLTTKINCWYRKTLVTIY